MAAFVVAAVYTYKIGRLLTKQPICGFIAAAIVMFNPNTLYLQSTPMGELLLLATLLGGTFYFIQWFANRKLLDLTYAAFWIFLATLVRYEAWMVLAVCAAIILIEAIVNKTVRARNDGQLVIFTTLGAFGIFIWILWNLVLLGNPLYWLNGPYSAKSQQNVLAAHNALPTKHNLVESFITMVRTVELNTGIILFVLATVALLYIVIRDLYVKRKNRSLVYVALAVLLAPILLDFVSLYLGIATIKTDLASIFNIRYGLEALPVIAVLIAVGLSTLRLNSLKVVAGAACVLAYLAMPITVSLYDPLYSESGSTTSIKDIDKTAEAFRASYKGGDILATSYGKPRIVFAIGLPFKSYVQEGDYRLWDQTLKQPDKYVSYVIMAKYTTKSTTPDPVFVKSYQRHKNLYKDKFDLIYDDNGYMVFARKSLHLTPVVEAFSTPQRSSSKAAAASDKEATSTSDSSSQPSAPAQKLVSIRVASGDSQTLIVRAQIHKLDKKHQLTSAQEAYVEGAMVQHLGTDSNIEPGQTITLDLAQLQSSINASKQLTASQLAAWQVYGSTIAY
ncbi:MAG: hypothetical protein WA843_00155 [Candidatus Saccharimonadales bacterium]